MFRQQTLIKSLGVVHGVAMPKLTVTDILTAPTDATRYQFALDNVCVNLLTPSVAIWVQL